MIHCPIGGSFFGVLSIFWKKKLAINSKPLGPIIMIGKLKKIGNDIFITFFSCYIFCKKFDIQMVEDLHVIERKVILLTTLECLTQRKGT
jgi:hypothetical protein